MPRTFIKPSAETTPKVSRKVALAKQRETKRRKRSEVVRQLQSPSQLQRTSGVVLCVPNDSQTNEIAALFSAPAGNGTSRKDLLRIPSAILATPPQEHEATMPASPPPRSSTKKVRAMTRARAAVDKRPSPDKNRKSPEQLFPTKKRIPLPRIKKPHGRRKRASPSKSTLVSPITKRVLGELTRDEVALIKAHRTQRRHKHMANPFDIDGPLLRASAVPPPPPPPSARATHTNPNHPKKTTHTRKRSRTLASHTDLEDREPPTAKSPLKSLCSENARGKTPPSGPGPMRKRPKQLTPARRAIIDAARTHPSDTAFSKRPRKSRVEADFDHEFTCSAVHAAAEAGRQEYQREQPIILKRKKQRTGSVKRSKIIRVPSFIGEDESSASQNNADGSVTESTPGSMHHASLHTQQEHFGTEQRLESTWQNADTQNDVQSLSPPAPEPASVSEDEPDLVFVEENKSAGPGPDQDSSRGHVRPNSSQLEREVFDNGMKKYGRKKKAQMGWRRKVPVPPLPQASSEEQLFSLASPESQPEPVRSMSPGESVAREPNALLLEPDDDSEEEGVEHAQSQVLIDAADDEVSDSDTPVEGEGQGQGEAVPRATPASPPRRQDVLSVTGSREDEPASARSPSPAMENSLSFLEPSLASPDDEGEPPLAVQELLHATLMRTAQPATTVGPTVCIPSSQSQTRREKQRKQQAVDLMKTTMTATNRPTSPSPSHHHNHHQQQHQHSSPLHSAPIHTADSIDKEHKTNAHQNKRSGAVYVQRVDSEMVGPTFEDELSLRIPAPLRPDTTTTTTTTTSTDVGSPMIFSNLSFIFTSISDRYQLEKTVTSHGGRVVRLQQLVLTDTADLGRSRCILISDSAHRSCKFLLALALGLPRVKPSWLHACVKYGTTNIPLAPHVIAPGEHASTSASDLKRMENHVHGHATSQTVPHSGCVPRSERLLSGRTVLVYGDVKFASELRCVLRAAGAATLNTLQEKHGRDTIIVLQPCFASRLDIDFHFSSKEKQSLLEGARELSATARQEGLLVVSMNDVIRWLVHNHVDAK